MIILLLIINSFIGFYTVKVTINSWRVYWFKEFGRHYYGKYNENRFMDNCYELLGIILGVLLAISFISVCNIFSRDSSYYIGLSKGRIFLSDKDIETLVYES